MDGRADLILLTIPSWISFHEKPTLKAMTDANAEDRKRTIWILPLNESPLNIETLIASNTTKKNSGKIDCKNDGLFFLLETIKLFLKYIVNLINKNYYSFLI